MVIQQANKISPLEYRNQTISDRIRGCCLKSGKNTKWQSRGGVYSQQSDMHSKLKYVAMDLHFVREKTRRKEEGSLTVQHIPETQQKTDILTKSLQPKPFLVLQLVRGGVLR